MRELEEDKRRLYALADTETRMSSGTPCLFKYMSVDPLTTLTNPFTQRHHLTANHPVGNLLDVASILRHANALSGSKPAFEMSS